MPLKSNHGHPPVLQGVEQGFGIRGRGGHGLGQHGTGDGLGQTSQQGSLSQQQLVKTNVAAITIVTEHTIFFTATLQICLVKKVFLQPIRLFFNQFLLKLPIVTFWDLIAKKGFTSCRYAYLENSSSRIFTFHNFFFATKCK